MSAAGELRLLPNLGGEEGEAWRRLATEPAVVRAAAVWASLFGASARFGDAAASPHPDPAFDWLPEDGAVAWWGDASAAADPAVAGHRWRGPDPEVAARVHDKAFALQHAAAAPGLRGIARVFEPDELADADAALSAIRRALDAWPAALRKHFCLKPRLGSSGRGRAGGRGDALAAPALRGSFARLAQCGGAILEPWLDRTLDLSVSFHVGEATSGPPLALLGSLVSIMSGAGVPLGHRGEIDHRGRVYSGSLHDDDVRQAGSELAAAAFDEGYRGPCGIDAFAWRDADGQEWLRAAVEFNARFTQGIVALGCLRRARNRLRSELGIEPGMRAGVIVAYDAPPRGWNEFGADLVLPIEVLPARDPLRGPAIVAARDPAVLDEVLHAVVAAPGHGSAPGPPNSL